MSSGGREPDVTDDEILAVLEESTDPALSTREIADAVGLGRRGTLDRLDTLAENGAIRKKKLDKRVTIWWIPDPDR